MDVKSFLSTALSSFWLPLLLGSLGIGALAFGLFSFSSGENEEEVVIEKAAPVEAETEEEMKTIFVDVEGAVVHPGVYELESSARVQDALTAAGGMHKDADRFAVAKGINMASKLSDGTKLYIPYKGEAATMTTASATSNTTEVAGATSSLINLNSASSSELEELDGVGPVTAKKIIDNRPYSAINDLLTKKVVGQSVFDKIKADITVN